MARPDNPGCVEMNASMLNEVQVKRSPRRFAKIAANTRCALRSIVSNRLIGLECDEKKTMKRTITILRANDLHTSFVQ